MHSFVTISKAFHTIYPTVLHAAIPSPQFHVTVNDILLSFAE